MAETAVVGYGHEDYGEGIFCDHHRDPYIKVVIIVIISSNFDKPYKVMGGQYTDYLVTVQQLLFMPSYIW